MMTSGLVVRLDSDAVLDALRSEPDLTIGEWQGDLLALVLEADGARASEERFEWLRRQPGVGDVEVVFVHWDENESEVPHAGV